jgi:ATP-dependent DNA helicase RecG
MLERNGIEESLRWLESSIQYLKGVGPVLAKFYGKLNVRTFEDLLYHLPFRYLDRRNLVSLNRVSPGKNQCVLGEVSAAGEVFFGKKRKRVFEAIFTDGTGFLTVIWFHYSRNYFSQRFKKGEKFVLFGEIGLYRRGKQMVHPEAVALSDFFDEEELSRVLTLVPIYSTTEGLRQNQIRKHLGALLDEASGHLAEPLPAFLLEKFAYPSFYQSFEAIHRPAKEAPLPELAERATPFHRRLAFCEFFFLQLGLGLRRREARVSQGISHQSLLGLRQRLLTSLPFELTEGQKRAVAEISRDMCNARPMNRLLQGDVGSGKTLVCLVAALLALENGFQVALMAPTEILAEQHAKNFQSRLAELQVDVLLLTSGTPQAARKEILEKIRSGRPALVVGTHALLEEEVRFENLSLAIVDEQHRFGVRQRLQLMRKGREPDVLVLTATPIPRSLAMTLYGDLDLSLMTEMPVGRRPVWTKVMTERNRSKLYEFVRKKVGEGRQAYFVFPLIEESEKVDLQDATRAFARLKKVFPEFSLAMLHGRMKNEEKEATMESFSRGKVQILVATTVIEVGIDIPNATMMVIEHAERFGLSQLHQLRGRVGRGSEKSYCVLASDFQKSAQARERLRVMEESTDGFKIAEEDLKIRGPGDFLGTRQSGMPELRVANLVTDLELLEAAKGAAQQILEEDPDLSSPEHAGLRKVLERRWRGRLGLAKVG